MMVKRHNHEHEPLNHPMLMGYNDVYSKMSKDRNIFLSEDITVRVAAELSALLFYYDAQDTEKQINLYIHTSGGSSSGLANIYDVMQMISAPIKTCLLGKCYSAGAFILAAGAKGKRYALRSSSVMIHGIQFAFPIINQDFTDSKNYLEFVKQENNSILEILAKHTGQTLEKIKTDCAQDYWMDAKEAKAYGIIDYII